MNQETPSFAAVPKNVLVTLILIGVVFGAAGALLLDPYLPPTLSHSKKGYDKGFAAAKKVVLDSSLGNFFKTPEDMRFVSGTITTINGVRITVRQSTVNPFDDPTLQDRVIIIASGTKIFNQAMRTEPISATSPIKPPVQEPIEVSALKVGDLVTVGSSINVRTQKEFPASTIRVNPTSRFAK